MIGVEFNRQQGRRGQAALERWFPSSRNQPVGRGSQVGTGLRGCLEELPQPESADFLPRQGAGLRPSHDDGSLHRDTAASFLLGPPRSAIRRTAAPTPASCACFARPGRRSCAPVRRPTRNAERWCRVVWQALGTKRARKLGSVVLARTPVLYMLHGGQRVGLAAVAAMSARHRARRSQVPEMDWRTVIGTPGRDEPLAALSDATGADRRLTQEGSFSQTPPKVDEVPQMNRRGFLQAS